MGSYDIDVANLLGEDVCDIILYEVDIGKINDQKMSDIAQKMSPTVYGNHQRRGGCDESEMRLILGDWIQENPDMNTATAIRRLKAIFKDRSVLLLPVIKKFDQSLGVRKTLGANHFNKLRRAAEMEEFNQSDCQKFAYQISPGLATTFHDEIRHRRYGPHTVDALLREWYGRCQDEMSFARMINILKDPAVGKASLAQKFMEAGLPSVETPVDVSEEMGDYYQLGAVPKRKEESVSNVPRTDSIIDLARGNYGKLKQRFKRWRRGEPASETNAFERALRTSQRENDRLRNALRTSQRENQELRNDQVSKKV